MVEQLVRELDDDLVFALSLGSKGTLPHRLSRLCDLVCQPDPAEPVWLPRTLSDQLGRRVDAPVQKLLRAQLRKGLGDPLPDYVSVDASFTSDPSCRSSPRS
jgi:hypothetical protein